MILAVIAEQGDMLALPVILSGLMVQGHLTIYPVPSGFNKEDSELWQRLDQLQQDAINAGDGVYVVDFDGVVSDVKRRYVEYAEQAGKQVYYHSKDQWTLLD